MVAEVLKITYIRRTISRQKQDNINFLKNDEKVPLAVKIITEERKRKKIV